MTLFWSGAIALVLGAVGFLVNFASGDFNKGTSPRWAKVVGVLGVIAMAAGTVAIVASIYYEIVSWF